MILQNYPLKLAKRAAPQAPWAGRPWGLEKGLLWGVESSFQGFVGAKIKEIFYTSKFYRDYLEVTWLHGYTVTRLHLPKYNYITRMLNKLLIILLI